MGAELNAALAKVQAELPDVAKNQTGEVRGVTKDGKPYSYDYKYADLDAVSEAILPLLGKHGLAFTGSLDTDDQDRPVFDWALLHESGDERTGRFPLWLVLPQRFTMQTLGGLETYARRYTLGPVTGVTAGGDNDAAGTGEVDRPPPRPARESPPQRPPSDVPTRPTVRTKTTGAEQEQLRHGTVEATPGDRPAQRSKHPAGQDEWTDQPANISPVVKARSQAIIMRFGDLEVTDREERLGITAKLAGWPEGKTLNSTNDLSKAQSERVMDQLSDLADHEALMALVTKGEKQDA
jgi:hypothetical protein